MRKVVVLVALAAIGACSFPVPTGLPVVSSMQEAAQWVEANIHSVTDMKAWGVVDYWASPEDTLAKGEGDCEDRAVLLAAIAYNILDIPKAEIVFVAADIGIGFHAFVRVDGNDYLVGPKYKELWMLSYDSAMLRAYTTH